MHRFFSLCVCVCGVPQAEVENEKLTGNVPVDVPFFSGQKVIVCVFIVVHCFMLVNSLTRGPLFILAYPDCVAYVSIYKRIISANCVQFIHITVMKCEQKTYRPLKILAALLSICPVDNSNVDFIHDRLVILFFVCFPAQCMYVRNLRDFLPIGILLRKEKFRHFL